MFKLPGFDLPVVAKESKSKSEKKKQDKKEGSKPSADDFQNLYSQLGRPSSSKPLLEVTSKASVPTSNLVKKPSKREAEKLTPSSQKHAKPDHKHGNKAVKRELKENLPDAKKPKRGVEQSKNSAPANTRKLVTGKKLTPLQLKMQQKLSGARFRWINEQLYTTDSQRAFDLFQDQPELFEEYHSGFRHQVESWPENPVNRLTQQFKERLRKPINAPGGLPGNKATGQVTVADMGCGEAELSLQLGNIKGKQGNPRFQVHSFDMTKANDRITVADIAHVPLPDRSVDVVVFCLALMGTNYEDFLREALRVLRPNGEIWIAEIKSRFEDISQFVAHLRRMGLTHKTTDESNKMFLRFEFALIPGSRDQSHKQKFIEEPEPETPKLKPCIYKRR